MPPGSFLASRRRSRGKYRREVSHVRLTRRGGVRGSVEELAGGGAGGRFRERTFSFPCCCALSPDGWWSSGAERRSDVRELIVVGGCRWVWWRAEAGEGRQTVPRNFRGSAGTVPRVLLLLP